MFFIDNSPYCGYNVGIMNITTKLIKDGNSTAVRLPKTALELSGLSGTIELVVNDGEIILKNAKTDRYGWGDAINADKPAMDKELDDWDSLAGEGLE